MRILAVEDEPDLALLHRLLLDPDQYTVAVAGDLETARTHLVTLPLPDLILLDLHLPDGCGLDLCREIRRRYPRLPIVILTACMTTRQEALSAGADVFMPKPFDLEELQAVVGRLLDGKAV